MKKRKPPLILASLLIILVGGSIAFNPLSRKKPEGADGAQQAQQGPGDAPEQKIDAPRDPQNPAATMNSIKDKMNMAAPSVQGAPKAPDQATGPAPSIHVPKPTTPVGPAPDPNRTMNQWYR